MLLFLLYNKDYASNTTFVKDGIFATNYPQEIIRKNLQGSKTVAFAAGEALSIPSVARSVKRDRSRDTKFKNLVSAKSAEGARISNGGGEPPRLCS